jgi:fucose permease
MIALIGASALYLMYLWLLSSIVAAYLAQRKGYSERAGLATGMVLSVLGALIWLVVPAKPDSRWKTLGPFNRGKPKDS